MSWRPKRGWVNPFSQVTHYVGNTAYGNFDAEKASIYEAGADAYGEAIKEKLKKCWSDADKILFIKRLEE